MLKIVASKNFIRKSFIIAGTTVVSADDASQVNIAGGVTPASLLELLEIDFAGKSINIDGTVLERGAEHKTFAELGVVDGTHTLTCCHKPDNA